MLSDSQKATYVANNGTECPFCKSNNIYFNPIGTLPPTVYVLCKGCRKSWIERYVLATITEE